MKRERILVLILIVTAVLSLLMTSLVTAASLADPYMDDQPQKEEAPQLSPNLAPAIVLFKTVGLDPAACANDKTGVFPPGATVVYCYEVQNIGDVNLTTHNLEDSELGTLLADFPFVLTPGSTAFLTQTAVIETSTINTGTWTASAGSPTNTVSYIEGATAIATDLPTCRFPDLAIPDNNITGTTSSMYLNSTGTLADLDIYLETNHTWVGDLKFTLEHVETGTTAQLLDRPGLPASTFGCQSDNIRGIIDDEALAAGETSCGPPNLALAGRYVGGDPADNTLLTAFDGEDLAGEWRLHVSDNANGDTGDLAAWCLLPTFVAPEITVTPNTLMAAQPPHVQTTQMLNIRNSGNAPLEWMIYEADETPTAPKTPIPFIMPALSNHPLSQAAVDAAETEAVSTQTHTLQTPLSGPLAAPPVNVLYDNGPIVNLPSAGAGGADASAVQNVSLGMNLYGFGNQIVAGNSVADDFTVTDPNGWYVAEILFFGYQTNSPNDSTITAVNYQIWDGPPNDPNSHILINPAAQNRLAASSWAGIYRVLENALDSTNRPIMQNTAQGGFVLPPGTYWLQWQTDGSSTLSGPWVPPVTISGVITTGNALQYLNNAWEPIMDGGGQQGMPFILSGYAIEDFPWAMVDPASGTLPSGTTEVMVTFDSSGLGLGVYTGTLFIASNDPYAQFTPVPLTLTVEMANLYLPFITKE